MTNGILTLLSLVICNGLAANDPQSRGLSLAGQDLQLTAPAMTVCAAPSQAWSQAVLLDGGVSVQIGDNLLSGRRGVLWLQPQSEERTAHETRQMYLARVYLEGGVSVQKGPKARTTSVQHMMLEGAEVLVTQFMVTGEVFATADSKKQINVTYLKDYDIYARALRAAAQIPSGPAIRPEARVPDAAKAIESPGAKPSKKSPTPADAAIEEQLKKASAAKASPLSEEPAFPVHVSALWEPAPEVRRTIMPDGQEVYTASGRFYIWQKQSDPRITEFMTEERVIEFMADNVVVFSQPGRFSVQQQRGNQIGAGNMTAIYLSGNIVMTEGGRTVRADELYYDFVNQRAIVTNASFRVFDENRGLPIYLRAKLLGLVSQDIFEARDVQLTSSEFYLPQMSLSASKMVLLSGEALQQHYRLKEVDDVAAEYEGLLVDVTAEADGFAFFKWPRMTTNFARPDIPLRRVAVGNDDEYGTSIETRWHLSRLLGLRDPKWLDSELMLDYFSDRGVGTGVEAEYQTDNAKGSVLGYIMTDRGEDDLSRNRKNIDPEQDIRGRFSFRHRQYLPDDWQLTLEAGYVSDRNFLESMYRTEFFNDKGQETLIYLKRLRDNWAFSILGKIRVNDFETMTEELPSVEYHLKGQSFWDHRLTFYSDTQVARFRERFDEQDDLASSGYYSYAFTRNEVDLPLTWETVKVVPFAAGSYSYEDHLGYRTDLDGTPLEGQDQVFLGEAGVRASTMFWKADPYYRSALWDLNGMRHIVTPYVEAVMYEANEDAVDMRDVVHAGVSQRWQTHRGSEQNMRSLDWMRLDLEATWLSDTADASIGPYRTYGPAGFVYNDPSIPFLLRRDENYYGMVRDALNGEYIWRVSDTFSLLSDINYDLDSGHVQQLNVGVSRLVYPDISYYLGTRYLRPVIIPVDEDNDGNAEYNEEGSNSFVASMTYRLSPRYVATFSQEYNFDFGESIRTDLTLVRRYHRMFYAVSVSFDESLDRNTVLFSIWPQGIKELAVGSRKHAGLTRSGWED